MTDFDRLRTLFDEIGDYQRATELDGMPLSVTRPEMMRRLREAFILMPPGNERQWTPFHAWIMQSWAISQQHGGDSAAEPWRQFLIEVVELLGPAVD